MRVVGAFVVPKIGHAELGGLLAFDGVTCSATVTTVDELVGACETHRPDAVIVGIRWLDQVTQARAALARAGIAEPLWIALGPSKLDRAIVQRAGIHAQLDYAAMTHRSWQAAVAAARAAAAGSASAGASADEAASDEIRIVATFRRALGAHALAALLSPVADLRVVATCTTAAELVAAIDTHRPHLGVLGYDCFELLAEVRATLAERGMAEPRWGLATSHAEPATLLSASAAGVALLFTSDATDSVASLVSRVREYVRTGASVGTPLDRASATLAVAADADDRRILALLVDGKSNQQIADKVHLSLQTVKNRLSRMMKVAGATNRTELALRFAAR